MSKYTPVTKAGNKLSKPTPPIAINTLFKAVIYTGVGVTGSVSGVIQNVGLKIRLITSKIMKELTTRRPGITSKITASFVCDFELLLFIRIL